MSTRTQAERGHAFRALHHADGAFIIPNPWNPGSARLLSQLGFAALATTSAGFAFSTARQDGAVGRDDMLDHARSIVAATDLPVSADLEYGYAVTLDEVAETYRRAAAVGLVGASIEDATGNPDRPIYDIAEAADRVRAAAETVHALPYPFTLTGRCENYLHGRRDLADTIRRLQAYQEAGADVLFAPDTSTREEITAIVTSVDRPVSVLMGLQGVRLTQSELSEMGVKRISVGSSLCHAAFGAFLSAAREMQINGTFTYAESAVPFREINGMFG
ncbi:MAG TPA: isocitrate lyase/phosphoenolpyruvate mutase family protein [Gemmatimonadales bacterium]|jgi:2-methylisocitrate lyase-like PEP mutase family enzyme